MIFRKDRLVLAAAQYCERNQCITAMTSAMASSKSSFFGVFFSIFEPGSITKHLMTGLSGNSEI